MCNFGYHDDTNPKEDEDWSPDQNSPEGPNYYQYIHNQSVHNQSITGDSNQTSFNNQQAGHDINQDIDLSPQLYLQSLADVISNNPDIPDEHKGPIVNQLKRLSNNPWVQRIGAAVIIEGAKKLAGL